MPKTFVDLTKSSLDRDKTTSHDPLLLRSLSKAINDAQPFRLRLLLHELCRSSPAHANWLADRVLVTQKTQAEGTRKRKRQNDEDDEEDQQDEDDSDNDNSENSDDTLEQYEPGMVKQKDRTRHVMGPVKARYAMCVNCDEEFDVTDNRDDEGCVYHDGDLEVNEDGFVDHDEDCHGPMDTEDNRRDFPQGFLWSCCEGDGDASGCQTDKHMAK